MYKSKLHELCQRWRWPMPEYNTMKDGPQHLPRFSATVNVNGHMFYTTVHHKSAKEAENSASHIAIYHLNSLSAQVTNYAAVNYPPQAVNYPNQAVNYSGYQVPQTANTQMMTPFADGVPIMPISPSPSELPIPTFPPSVLIPKTEPSTGNLKNEVAVQQNFGNNVQIPTVSQGSLQAQKEKLHIYKNLLQRYALEKAIALPVYDTKTEGPGHSLRFKTTVSIDGQSYETQESFTTLKEAEQVVAKVACEALAPDLVQEDDVSYKNVLQELAMKRGLDHLSYTTTYGLSHMPTFVTKVELGTLAFHGGEAKTKKQAEMNAAKVAYYALIDGSQSANLSIPSSVCGGSSLDQSTIVNDGTLRIEERESTRKQRDLLDEETQLQLKRAKASAEDVNANADIPVVSNIVIPPNNPALAHDETTEAKSIEPVVILPPATTGSSQRTVLVPHKTTLVIPEHSSSTKLPISDDQWTAYKVEDPGTIA